MSYSLEFHKRMEALQVSKSTVPGGVLDMHLHMVDFIQNTEGLHTLLGAMDEANVTRAVIFGLPVTKKWAYYEPEKPHYYLDNNTPCYYFASTDEIVATHYLDLSKEERIRFAPTLCGFNPTDLCSIDYIKRMFEKYDFWAGIGEVLLRHDDLTNLTIGEVARVNHPGLYDVLTFCEEKNVPINIHQNCTSVWHNDEYEYLHELREILDKFPKVTVLWAHCGVSRRVTHKQYTDMLHPMLSTYKNLYVDLSWVVYDDVVLDAHKRPKPHWIELITKYPDRFMIGSDVVGHFDTYGKTIGRYNALFEALPEKVAAMVARENASRLWFSR